MSDWRLDILKSQIWNATGITVRLSSNMISKYRTNISDRLLLLPGWQNTNICKTFSNQSSANIKW